MRSVVLLVALAACRPGPRMTVPASRGAAIGTVSLRWSQVHVVLGEHPLIIDSGSPGDFGEIVKGLRTLGVDLHDVKCAVITHGHADHAGTARALQVKGITIIAGAADRDRTTRGIHGPHHPTSWFASLLKHVLPDHYKPFTADVEVTDRYDLAPCGIAGEAVWVGGHTPGSLVVLLAGGRIAVVGDLFRGGALAGYVHKSSPKVHFYQDAKPLAHQRIRELLARGVELFVMGHGGPSSRAQVERAFGH
jgi:hydroxyacylglutathione hydrolase